MTEPLVAGQNARGFWGADSLIGFALFGLYIVWAVAGSWPQPIYHTGVRAALRTDTYDSAQGRPVVVIFPRDDRGRDSPRVVRCELPAGQEVVAAADVTLDPFVPEPSLTVRFWSRPAAPKAIVDADAIRLVDSEGFRFHLREVSVDDRFRVYDLADRSSVERVRFNDDAYYLSLTIPFELAGARSLSQPLLRPSAFEAKGGGDTPAHGIAMFGAVVVGLFLPAVLMGLAWGRRRLAIADARRSAADGQAEG